MFGPSGRIEISHPITTAWVDDLAKITPLSTLVDLAAMKAQLPEYLRRARLTAPSFDKTDVKAYTTAILAWWRINATYFPAWALAARIVFAFTPNSAGCERVFSLLKNMFGDQQMVALSDYLEAALMLAYNKRTLG